MFVFPVLFFLSLFFNTCDGLGPAHLSGLIEQRESSTWGSDPNWPSQWNAGSAVGWPGPPACSAEKQLRRQSRCLLLKLRHKPGRWGGKRWWQDTINRGGATLHHTHGEIHESRDLTGLRAPCLDVTRLSFKGVWLVYKQLRDRDDSWCPTSNIETLSMSLSSLWWETY